MRKTRINKNKILLYAVLVFLIVFLIIAAFLLMSKWEKQQVSYQPSSDIDDTAIYYNGNEYVLKNNVETLLLIGLDKFESTSNLESYNNDQQADFLMLFVLDNDAKKCTAVHINRDTMARVNVLGVNGNKIDTVDKQIALAHTYGNGKNISCRNTSDSVSELLLGMRIDHYVSVTMDSVAVFNDLVGGVEVTVLDDFSGIDDKLIKGENVTLTGEQALRYIRTRYGLEDSSNIARMERQRQYINALYQKTVQCMKKDDGFAVEALLKMSNYIVTDRTAIDLQEQLNKMTEYGFDGIRTIEGESTVGEQYMEFYPDDNSIMELVIDLFYEPKN
jgi:LCP family protein required for cell wall assembly